MTENVVENLGTRVARLEAVADITRLEARYALAWDSTDAVGWADLFTPDGIFERVDVPGKDGHRKVGRDELEAFCRRHQEGFGRFHLMHGYDIDVAEDGATATARVTFECRIVRVGDHPQFSSATGFYDSAYAVEAGRWRIRHRKETLVLFGESTFFGIPQAP
ncbi:hypothetical protein GCM10009836_60740 [Pseudonocardia ailaonensis]|uniref:SnoaL-like domain-containing protein n=1 Tax=Pseudonocardia ailaonensis TaxID=367279 RepID=A0ABN2NJC7_9PSEU